MKHDTKSADLSQVFSHTIHTIDTGLAFHFGVEGAILIQHFIFWIRLNRDQGKNRIDNRTWTYQTRKQIQAHFPYWNMQTIRYQCELLVERGILMTSNHNKSPIDKTLWYAFIDEEKFVPFLDKSKNVYESGKPQSSADNRTPIPDKLNKDISINKNKSMKSVPPKPLKLFEFSEPAVRLTSIFISRLQENSPKFIPPKDRHRWHKDMDALLKEQSEEDIIKLIDLMTEDLKNNPQKFNWGRNIRSPEKLRKHFAAAWDFLNVKMNKVKSNQASEKHRINKYYKNFVETPHQNTVDFSDLQLPPDFNPEDFRRNR